MSLVVIAVLLGWALTTRAAQPQHLYVVRLPIKDIEIRPVLCKGKASKSETFAEVIGRTKPYAAINGTFYDPDMKPLGDIVCDGKLINRGHYPNALAVTNAGKVGFVQRKGRRFDWTGYKVALAAGPRLVHKRQVKINMNADGFSKAGLTKRAVRSAVGITAKQELLLVVETDWVTIPELAQTMVDLGAVEAMNLDGGPASGLYHDGKTLVSPMLRMTNVLTVAKRSR